MPRHSLIQVVRQLQARYGEPEPPVSDPWLLILSENVAYLANDERRKQALDLLQRDVGTDPEKILSASPNQLLRITGHGILAEQFAEKLRRCARILLEEFDGALGPVLKRPLDQAKRALRKFPGIGEPGAEKILLFCHACPILALESNGLRVLLRLGYGEEKRDYTATYRLVSEAVEPELERDCAWLIKTHQLLRRHGQELCKRSKPLCEQCPVNSACAFFQATRGA
jgi:endonuclease III